MELSNYPATDITTEHIKRINIAIKIQRETILSGVIPPVTIKTRHTKIDQYIRCNRWLDATSRNKFLDIGCGFPPLTTLETASYFKNWEVIGADPIIPEYIIFDKKGYYATFDNCGNLLYIDNNNNWELWENYNDSKKHFTDLFISLHPPKEGISSEVCNSIEIGGVKLITNPIEEYKRDNLKFFRYSIGEYKHLAVNIVRCFNLLSYFDLRFRNSSLNWFSNILLDGGLVILGDNRELSTRCRYTVYRKELKRLVIKEFSFSLDNLRPIPPSITHWLSFYDNDFETRLLAQLVGTIRSNTKFRNQFDQRLDDLLLKNNLYCRDKDGFLLEFDTKISTEDRTNRIVEVFDTLDKEGYVDEAVNVLKSAGYKAWRNCIGFISILPN
jgi:hypothetical protein